MNVEASKLGLADTHFTSPDGLPYPTEFSTYSPPGELVTLGEAAMQNAVFRSIVDLKGPTTCRRATATTPSPRPATTSCSAATPA